MLSGAKCLSTLKAHIIDTTNKPATVECSLTTPGTNGTVERICSTDHLSQTDEKNRFSVETIKSTIKMYLPS